MELMLHSFRNCIVSAETHHTSPVSAHPLPCSTRRPHHRPLAARTCMSPGSRNSLSSRSIWKQVAFFSAEGRPSERKVYSFCRKEQTHNFVVRTSLIRPLNLTIMSASAPTAAFTTTKRRVRRARTIITAPLPRDGRVQNDMANALLLDAQLTRLIDRQRHAIARITDSIPIIRRFRFDGLKWPSCYDLEHSWWFHAAATPTAVPRMRRGSVLARAPPTGTRRWCYHIESHRIAHVIKLDWQEITTTTVADVFSAWQNESALKQTAGLGECMRECAPRRKAVRKELDPILLHVWNLRHLIEEHIRRHCMAADAWKLEYHEGGLVEVPPLRITARDIFPMTEHEAQVLQRRPQFANLLHRDFVQQHYYDAVPRAAAAATEETKEEEEEEEADEPAAAALPATTPATAAPARTYGQPGVVRPFLFRDDRSILSNVTPDYNSDDADDDNDNQDEAKMDTSA